MRYITYYNTQQKIYLITILCTYIVNFQIFYYFKTEIYYLIIFNINYPYFISNSIYELLLLTIYTIITTTFLITSPTLIIFYYYYQKPTYYLFENKKTIPHKALLIIYLYLIIFFLTFKIAPTIWNLLITYEIYNNKLLVELLPTLKNYLTFVNLLYIYTLIGHCLGYALYYILTTQLTTTLKTICFTRGYIYPIITFFFALLTPPDIISLLGLILPFSCFYEILLYYQILLLTTKKSYKKPFLRKIGFEPMNV